LDRLHQTLQASNRGGDVGTLVGDNQVTKIWLNGYLKTAQEVGQLVVGSWQGKAIYLRDIASIIDGQTEANQLHRLALGGASKQGVGEPETPAVSIALSKKRGSNAVVAPTT